MIYSFYSPNLTWRDIQHLIVRNSISKGLTYGDFFTNGAGHEGISLVRSAVFNENLRYCYSLGVVVVMEGLWRFVMSLLLLKIYLLETPKSNPYYQGNTIQNTFFFTIMALFRLSHFIFYHPHHSQALIPPCGALVCVFVTLAYLLLSVKKGTVEKGALLHLCNAFYVSANQKSMK